MLTRSRLCAAGLASAIAAATIALAAGPAAAAPASSTTPASRTALAGTAAAYWLASARPGFPASAASRLEHEMIAAWQLTQGTGVTVALLSTGVVPVSGLAGKVIQGPDYAPLRGASVTDGTVLASLIAGSGPTGTNPFGSIGRAPGAKILAERIFDPNSAGGGKYQRNGVWQPILARAIRYAVNHGAQVILTFEAGSHDTPALDAAVGYALSKNVVIIGASLNLGGTPTQPAYPDSQPGVINVSQVALAGLPKPSTRLYSPANSSVLVSAPANRLFATGPGNGTYTAWGSYSALAWAAGTVAMIKSLYPQITPGEVSRALATSASYHPAGGYSPSLGFGLINPLGALHAAAALVRLHTSSSSSGSASARFGRPQAAVISAVRHSAGLLAGYGAALAAGLILLAAGLILATRRRRVA